MIARVYHNQKTNPILLVLALVLILLVALTHSFAPVIIGKRHHRTHSPSTRRILSLGHKVEERRGLHHNMLGRLLFSTPTSTAGAEDFSNRFTADATVNEIKAKLVQVCDSATSSASSSSSTSSTASLGSKERVHSLVSDLLDAAEKAKIGQNAVVSGLLPGRWELIYSSEDDTRSSPFFWAFRQAFPEQSDQIFGITDAIPAPLKEVGPAYQTIEFSAATQSGSLVSRVKVATIGGAATSIMTTRATITGTNGVDGIRLQVDTTKPEDSTILKSLGPLGVMISDNAPAFPSGQALEQIRPGASQVVVRTPFCDEGLRISRNDARPNDVYIWRRTDFAVSEIL